MAISISLEMGAPYDWANEEQSKSGANHIKNFIKTLKKFEFESTFDARPIIDIQKHIYTIKNNLNFTF